VKVSELLLKLTMVSLSIPGSLRAERGLAIRFDGVQLSPADWDTQSPVDPGKHTIEISALDRKPYRRQVTIDEGEPTVLKLPAQLELVDPPPGQTVWVQSTVAGTVVLDGDARARVAPRSPVRLDHVPDGVHRIALRHRWGEEQRFVDIRATGVVSVTFEPFHSWRAGARLGMSVGILAPYLVSGHLVHLRGGPLARIIHERSVAVAC
jgi:hypothetical protein